MFLEAIEMKNEDLKDRLLQDKDAKALENEDLRKVSGGDWDPYDVTCKGCGQKVAQEFDFCPYCGYDLWYAS